MKLATAKQNSRLYKLLRSTLGMAFLLAGCSQTPTPPAPLAIAEIPATLTKAYAAAQPELKDLAAKVVAAVQGKDYPEAYTDLQLLCVGPGQNKEQRLTATRTMLTLTSLLQAAQTQGDPQAAAALKVYQMTK